VGQADEVAFEDAYLGQDPFWFPLEFSSAVLFISKARFVTNLRPVFKLIFRYFFT
jgi:hypothetical protein